MKIINWVKLFKSKDAKENLIGVGDYKEEMKNMRTLELEINGTYWLIFPDVYLRKEGKLYAASKTEIDMLIGEAMFDSFLSEKDKDLFKAFIKKVFDFEDLIEYKK